VADEGIDRAREAAARRAVESVHGGLRIALGTGSTMAVVVKVLALRFPKGHGLDLVASSRATEELARSLGLPLRALREYDHFDLMIDGADEVAPNLDLTKGGGGALLREKLLARLSARLIVVVDESKLVARLGERARLPVEVVPFCRPVLERQLTEAGFAPHLRASADGRGFRTDNGNEILDLAFRAGIDRPGELDRDLRSRVGVVETGLFVGLAERVIVGAKDGTARELVAPMPGR
jgi:ribose 5-phosphate isomerase A